MALFHEFLFLLFSHLMLLANGYQGECPASFSCGYLGNISFPFTTTERQDCGLLPMPNCDGDPMKPKMIKYQNKGKWFEFEVKYVGPLEFHGGNATSTCIFRDNNIYKLLQNKSCEAFRYNYTLPPTSHFVSFHTVFHATLFMCNRTLHVNPPTYMHNYTKCLLYDLYYQPYNYADKCVSEGFYSLYKCQASGKRLRWRWQPFYLRNCWYPNWSTYNQGMCILSLQPKRTVYSW